MALNLAAQQNRIATAARDLTKAVVVGDFAPPAAGATRLRLVGYVETGVHKKVFKGEEKFKPQVELTFELSGPKHQPRKTDSGVLIPHRIVVKESVGFTVKNGYMKLFNQLNHDGSHTNFVTMLMESSWRGSVLHREYTIGDQKRIAAELKSRVNGYQIFAPTYEDPDTGELKQVTADPAITAPRLFLWEDPDLDQWDSLYIDGTYDNGDTKNVLQERIKRAENFVGSPIYDLLKEAGRGDELEPVVNANSSEDPPEDGEEAPQSPAKAQTQAKAGNPTRTAAAKPTAAPDAVKKGAAPTRVVPKRIVEADPLAGDDGMDDDIPF